MNKHEHHPAFDGLAPLVDAAGAANVGVRAAPTPPTGDRLRSLMARARRDEDLKWLRRVGAVCLGVAVLMSAGWGVMALIPRSIPDYQQDSMDEVLDYTLLSDDFSNLPVDKRLALIKDLIERLKTMSADDSAMMAMFAAGIKDEMRRQLEENAKRLAVDVADKFARDYEGVPPEEAPEFLDQKALEFVQMMEDLSGQKSGLPEDPEERMAALRRQASRDQQRAKEEAPKQMDSRRVGNFIGFLQRDASETSGPEQRGRVTKFARDMTRHLRGQDVSTGKPLKNPATQAPPSQPEQPADGPG